MSIVLTCSLLELLVSSTQEKEENLSYEFAKSAPSMFDKGLMRKNTKSVLGALIKGQAIEDISKSTRALCD